MTSLDNGKSVVVRINDRGPFHSKRIIDLSYTAAHKLGIIGSGSRRVEVESVTPGDEAKKDDAPEAPGTYLQLGSFSSRSHAEKALADAQGLRDNADRKLAEATPAVPTNPGQTRTVTTPSKADRSTTGALQSKLV